jgi:hypothetical protein
MIQCQGIGNRIRQARKLDAATFIDRETGVAELLEAARDAEESLRHVIEEAKTFRNPQPWKTEMREERHTKLRAAIAKVEGSGH